jgi:very-short-patch-repair endonuclease
MICENCEIVHNRSFGSGRFCSLKCSRAFSTKGKRKQINEKIAKTIKSKTVKVKKTCKFCKAEFEVIPCGDHQEYCSRMCSSKGTWSNSEFKKRLSTINSINAIKRHRDPNSNFGWQSRSKLKPSYPETIAIGVLSDNGINYIRELKVGKFFIDFALIDTKIAIEIDGQQHTKPERVELDKRKDKFLIENGWTIYRIKWPSDNIVNTIKSILESISST